MKSLYKDQGRKIGKYPAVSLDKNDILLVGSRGWIFIAEQWPHSPEPRLGMVRLDANKVEKLTYHDFKDLGKLILRIDRFIGITSQVHHANNPNDRRKGR
jgi:hypothetical protein